MLVAVAIVISLGNSHPGRLILEGARAQLINPASYTPDYFALSYPNGDPPAEKGACTDVVVRSLRHAGYDLQKLIFEDAASVSYPGIKKRDPNIDHRRCPNQRRYFERFGRTLPVDKDFRPGDIVYWKLPGNLDHTGIITDKKGWLGDPMVIHNISQTAEEDVLHSWPIMGHYRFPR